MEWRIFFIGAFAVTWNLCGSFQSKGGFYRLENRDLSRVHTEPADTE
jgi:hypothetical protein